MALDQIQGKPVEKVGVLVVHGIGEQRRFAHLESETRNIVNAIIANYGARRRDVTVTLSTGTGDAFQGEQSSWVSGAEAPLHALVEFEDENKIVDIAFHEVWWADVNEKLTLGKQVRFWLWGLSMPGIATHNEPFLPGAAHTTRRPDRAGELTWLQRLRLGYVAMMFAFSAFSIALINLILKRLNFEPLLSTGVIVNLLSGVKIYSQHSRAGGSPMDGPDEPPRVAIRRRMVRAMVDVAAADYERWYILAHSLGSVVAWNGVMETAETLPNYLDRARWETLPPALVGTSPHVLDVTAMMPNRPVWLGRREFIDRDALFKNFCGLLTYGAPLERFAALWATTVPINCKEDPFPDRPHDPVPVSAEWINVYDPTDPVGTWITDFDPDPATPPRPGHTVLKPHNFPCRSSAVLLLGHICYFAISRWSSVRLCGNTPDLLVNQVAHWLVRGGSLAAQIAAAPRGAATFWMPLAPGGAAPGGRVRARSLWRGVQWVLVGVLLTVLTLLSWHYVVYPLIRGIASWFGFKLS